MRISNCIRAVVVFCSILAGPAVAATAEVNGIQLYYEIHGRGTPVVMLHGGYTDSDMWRIQSKLLARRYRVIEIDSRGHGRSTDGQVPITYGQMADDTLALLDQLQIPTAHFVGWSDGAVIASHIAARHPERVDQLVLIGAAFQGNVYVNIFSALLGKDILFNVAMDLLFSPKYKAVNPNPEHWRTFRDKLHSLWQSPCYFEEQPEETCLEPLQSITAPTLVVAGKLEIIEQSHTRAIAEAIPNAQLEIVAGAGHFLPITRPYTTAELTLEFLNN